MDSLADTLRLFQSGALGRVEMYARLDRLLASTPESVSSLLRTLNEAHRRAPLPAEVYGEVERRIAQAIEVRQRIGQRIGESSRQRVGDEETFVQTNPSSPTQPAGVAGDGANPPVERMKGVGDTLNGRFVLEECIGFGGMGTVYKALDLAVDLGRQRRTAMRLVEGLQQAGDALVRIREQPVKAREHLGLPEGAALEQAKGVGKTVHVTCSDTGARREFTAEPLCCDRPNSASKSVGTKPPLRAVFDGERTSKGAERPVSEPGTLLAKKWVSTTKPAHQPTQSQGALT